VVADSLLMNKLMMGDWNIQNFSTGMLSLLVFLMAKEGEGYVFTKEGSYDGCALLGRSIKGCLIFGSVFTIRGFIKNMYQFFWS
jgi:hypothetical protein